MTLRKAPDARLMCASIALVWLYQGLWCKLLDPGTHQREMVASVPLIGVSGARTVLIVLGLVECCLAGWVLLGKQMRAAALVQTALLIAMNAGGLIWGWRQIPDPGGMIVQNFAFLVLVWVAAEERSHVAQY